MDVGVNQSRNLLCLQPKDAREIVAEEGCKAQSVERCVLPPRQNSFDVPSRGSAIQANDRLIIYLTRQTTYVGDRGPDFCDNNNEEPLPQLTLSYSSSHIPKIM